MVPFGSFGALALALIVSIVIVKNVKKFKETNIPSKKIPTFVAAIGILTITAFLPLALPLLIIGAISRVVVHIVLNIKHGRKYMGLVSGADAIHTIDSPSNSKTAILGILEQSESSKSVVDVVREHFECTLRHMEKLQSTYHNFMGYTYMVRTTMDQDECIREMGPGETVMDELGGQDLVKLLSDTYNADFPRGNTIFWDVWVSSRPIRLKEASGGRKKYLCMFRIHHCVADGVAIFKLLVGILSQAFVNVPQLDQPKKSHKMSLSKQCVESLKVVLFAPSSILVNLLVRGTDQNFLHNGPLNGDSHLIFRVEQDGAYFQKIKAIKRRLPGTSFPDIVLTALSASLSDFYYEKSSIGAEYITVAIPVVPGAAQLLQLTPGSLTIAKLNFSNNYALVLLNLPLCAKTSILSRLNLIKDEVKAISNSVDYQVNYIFMRALAMLPRPLIRLALKTLNCTAAVSIMPGSCKLTCGFDGPIYTDMGFWIPHLKKMGVGFSIFTYDERLFVGLSVDKSLPISVDEGNRIINNAFSYIDMLEKEIDLQEQSITPTC